MLVTPDSHANRAPHLVNQTAKVVPDLTNPDTILPNGQAGDEAKQWINAARTATALRSLATERYQSQPSSGFLMQRSNQSLRL